MTGNVHRGHSSEWPADEQAGFENGPPVLMSAAYT